MPATQLTYGFIPGQLILLIAVVAATGLFARDVMRHVRIMRLGAPAARIDHPVERTRGWLLHVIGQGRLLTRRYAGIMHALIFWGFLVITVSTIEYLVRGLWPGRFPLPLPTEVGPFLVVLETFQALVLVGIALALYRRWAVKPWYLTLSADAIIILSLITTLMISAFLAEAFLIVAAPEPHHRWAYISSTLAGALVPLGPQAALSGHIAFWWLHMLTVLGFLAYLPHSKHQHIVTAPFNVWFRNLAPKGQLPYLNVEEAMEQEKPLGVASITDLTWKDLLDTYTCTECGRCTSECPASNTGKPLSPKDLILDLRHYMAERAPSLLGAEVTGGEIRELVGEVIKDDVLWDCTTCRACVDACPVFIDHVPKIVNMRRHLVMGESRMEKEVQGLLENLEATGNPWRFPRNKRSEWADGLGVPTLEQAPDAEVLYWVGCFGSYDERSKKVARALARVLQRVGVSFAILGPNETCSGDPARRVGNEYLYQMLAMENVETLNAAKEAGVRTIVTACPHCFNTISSEYPQFGGSYQVLHHTQFLAQLVADGRLKPEVAREAGIAYHDPCYLGRYNDTYDQPRQVLSAIPGVDLKEIAPCRERAMCCGAGGGHAFMQETRGNRINHLRLEQAMEGGPDLIATACPYCLMMFEDATGAKGVSDTLPVQDVAELVEGSLPPSDGAR